VPPRRDADGVVTCGPPACQSRDVVTTRRAGLVHDIGRTAIASSHHERLDGSGYHRATRGSDIPLLGRYLAAADVYHALLEERDPPAYRCQQTPNGGGREDRR
jgi:HD-GYP domain-containing protein (c-di-GMP phosphodiesterase class II)